MKALVYVTLKPDVLDPQGKAIRTACGQLGYGAVRERAPGQALRDRARRARSRGRGAAPARASSRTSCSRIPVIEDYAILKIELASAIPRLRADARGGSSVSGSKSRPVICSNASM